MVTCSSLKQKQSMCPVQGTLQLQTAGQGWGGTVLKHQMKTKASWKEQYKRCLGGQRGEKKRSAPEKAEQRPQPLCKFLLVW